MRIFCDSKETLASIRVITPQRIYPAFHTSPPGAMWNYETTPPREMKKIDIMATEDEIDEIAQMIAKNNCHPKEQAHIMKWVPTSERLPAYMEAVIATCIDHRPPAVYGHCKNVPFMTPAVYMDGWYWWSEDIIDGQLMSMIDGSWPLKRIEINTEVIAWMPFPQIYKKEGGRK